MVPKVKARKKKEKLNLIEIKNICTSKNLIESERQRRAVFPVSAKVSFSPSSYVPLMGICLRSHLCLLLTVSAFLTCCGVGFASILLRIFIFLIIRDIGLQISFLAISPRI